MRGCAENDNSQCCKFLSDFVTRNLRILDALDFDAFSYDKDPDMFRQIHTPDVVVTYPDGTKTVGIEDHKAAIDVLFAIASDMHVSFHTIAFGQRNLTIAIAILEGTVSSSATSVFPNAVIGNTVRVRFATFNVWNKKGSFPREELFFDNNTLAEQVTDPNQGDPNKLRIALFDTSNITQANYFKVCYDQEVVDSNLDNIDRFYKAVNSKQWCEVKSILHKNLSFVRPNGTYGETAKDLVKFLRTLDLPGIVLTHYKWFKPRERLGARDWTAAIGIIQVFSSRRETVPPTVKPAVSPKIYPSPIPMLTVIRWHENKISEIHIFWDNQTIINQLSSPKTKNNICWPN